MTGGKAVDDVQAALVEQMTKKFVGEGRLIEAGWQAMRLLVLPVSAPDVQLVEMRKAYFTGAQHLFASIVGMVDDDGTDEPSPDDLNRMDLIHKELEGFTEELRRQVGRT